jgi:hypothetical protein
MTVQVDPDPSHHQPRLAEWTTGLLLAIMRFK